MPKSKCSGVLKILLAALFLPVSASAQATDGLISQRSPVRVKSADKKFWALTAGFVLASAYDIETAFHDKQVLGPYCEEANPVMRPLINSGRPATYALTGVVDGLAMYFAYRLKSRHSKWWWLVPTTQIGAHSIAGSHNIRVAQTFHP